MLITHAKIITWVDQTPILEDYAIKIIDGLITQIGPTRELDVNNDDENILNAAGQYVLPGNICAHTHFYGTFARGLAVPGEQPKDFPEILQKLWWPLDRSLDRDAIRISAAVNMIDAIKHGTTTLIDHHASPDAIDGSLDIIAEVVETAGLRAVLCYEITDRNGETGTKAGIKENLRFLDRTAGKCIAGGRVAATFGMHASLTLSEKTLERCREVLPQDTGIHIHVAEHEIDQSDSIAKTGLRVIDRLSKHELLGSKSILAHAVHVNDSEIEILSNTNTWVTHQPRSNMNNGVGVSRVETLMNAGVRVCLGTDGFSHAMWQEWKTAYLIQKLWHRDPRRMDGSSIIEMAIKNNAALASLFFPDAPVGFISEGSHADLIFVDYHSPTPILSSNIPWHILFGFNESMITTTIVGGQVLMKNRQLTTLDEEEITNQARKIAPVVWKRYNEQL